MADPVRSRSAADTLAGQPQQKAAFVDDRASAVAQRRLANVVRESPQVHSQRSLSAQIQSGATQAAQRKQIRSLFGQAVRLKEGLEEEEPLQGKLYDEARPIQRKEESGGRENRAGLPDPLKGGIESLSGMSMDDVQVRYNSSKPAQLQALAYTQGNQIHVGPGQERHLAHEAWHVVQQKQGRVRPTIQLKEGVPVNDDAGLEKEADQMGAKALQRKEKTIDQTAPRKSISFSNSKKPIQAKLGFEIEMLVLVDDNGRPVPEKEKLGDYGAHCELVVDHGPSVATNTPENAEASESDVAMTEGYKRWWYHAGSNAWFESEADALVAHPGGGLEEYYFNVVTGTSHRKSAAALDWEALWWHPVSAAIYRTQALALAAHPPPEVIEKYYHQKSTGTAQYEHPFRPELGTDRYASIIEIVTNAYAPETPAGRTSIIQSMTDARTLAEAIHGANPRTSRFKLNTVVPGISDRYYIGNPAQAGQTVDGSIQSNFGIELSEIEAFVDKTINDNQGGQIGGYSHPNYKVKHHTDVVDATHDEGDVVKTELVAAVANANAIVNAIHNPGAVPLPHLKGLMIIVCQYLRFGKIFYNNGYDVAGLPQQPSLVKNMIPMMSRTDMSTMFNELVPAAEKAVINATLAAVLANVLVVTGRTGGSALLNDPAEQTNENTLAWGAIYRIGCDTFIQNVFTQANDGVTANLGNIREMPPEKIDPSQWTRHQPVGLAEYYAHPGQPNQPNRPGAYREGAVFELRNMVPKAAGAGGVNRFIPATWPGLARYFCAFLQLQHVGPPPIVIAPPAFAPPPPAMPLPPPGPPGGGQPNQGCCCFITTACTRSRGLPDDCEELTVLRRFRDHYMRKLENGEEMINTYYEIAPRIVSAIDSLPYSKKVYEALYRTISECVECVKAGQYDLALHLYRGMILNLVKQYLGNDPVRTDV